MIDVIGLFNGKDSITFMPEQAAELQAAYKKNQPVRNQVTRQGKMVGKVLEQSNLLHACFNLVVENSNNPNHRNIDSVKMSCKVDIDFRDPRYCFVRPDGGVQLAYRSFKINGPGALQGKERDVVIQNAFEWCADVIGIDVDKMVEIAKSEMQRRHTI